LLSALVLGAGLVVRRRLLNRIDAIAATSQAIMEGQLDERIPREGGGGELDQLSGQLNAMLDRIDGLVRALGDVSDNIAHDLKTPLSRLRLTAEAALREPAATHADALSRIIEEADGLISTFNAMLLIAKLERGTPAPALETIDMAALVADTADLYGPVVEDAGARLQVGAAPDAFVSGNRQLLAQALANLIDNAIKYGAEGQAETPAIVLTVHADAGRVRIEVADRGPGIAAADRERALRRFVRLESSRTKPGTGLGLSLVAAIVRLHHGTLTLADNEPGLRVTIDLPAAAPPHATHAPRVRDVSADAG
jgi:signal transduction histidine kinase